MASIWTKNVNLPHFPVLKGDKKTDVLIIGGGMAGLLCAYFLQQQGVDYVLTEGRTICSGVTKNTTAKITSQHGLIYQDLVKYLGQEAAEMYLRANEEAIEAYAVMAEQIDCDFQRETNVVYSTNNRKKLEDTGIFCFLEEEVIEPESPEEAGRRLEILPEKSTLLQKKKPFGLLRTA